MNIIQIAGRLGRDPETRFTPSGLKVTTLTVATTARKGGKEETIWWRVTVWGERFDKMISFLKKGSAVIVIGEMHKPEIWTDREGRPQISLDLTADIIRFSPFGNPDQNKQEQPGGHTAQGQGQATQGNDNTNYGDFGGSAANYSMAGTNTTNTHYGTAQGSSTSKYSQAIPQNEEQLPF